MSAETQKEQKDQAKEKKQKPKYNMWQNSAFMIALAWREKEKKVIFMALLLVFCSVGNNLLNIYLTPTILAAVENRVSVSGLILIIIGFVGAAMFVSALSTYLNTNTLFGRVQVRSAIITALNRKAATTSYPNVGDEKFIKLHTKASEAASSNSQATEAIWNTLRNLTQNIINLTVYIVLLTTLEPWMMIVVLSTTLAGYAVSRYLGGYDYRHREEVAEYENRMWYVDGRAKDYSTAKDIRIFGIRPWLEELGEKALDAYMAFRKRANGVYFWSRVVDLLLTFLRNAIAYAYLIRLVLTDGLSASQFLLYFSVVGGLATWVTYTFYETSTLYRQSLDISTVRECLEYPEPFDLESGEALEPDNAVSYEIRLEDVSFRYPESDRLILEHVDLTLHPGEKLAVVGLNGAGKTTLVKLMCGFYDPTEGRVLLNGRDIREFKRRDYYRMFSAVFQDFSLLAVTVAANIAQTEDGIDMEKVRACAAQAGLLEKIESLPDGFETKMNRTVYEDAVMLSGGETQRLMLARALYKDAPVLLLDEPTAALDPIAEAELYQKYSAMTVGRSSVYISHRLASTRFCDRIILIENSRIAEEGSHEELLALGGRYAELFEVQSKYYREEGEEHEQA